MRCEKRFFSQKKRNEHDARHFKQGFSQVETCNVLYIIEKRNSVVHFFSGNSNAFGRALCDAHSTTENVFSFMKKILN